MTKTISYCGELVREHDADRFLLSLFLKAEYREAVWALLAFNHEIAKTREIVSESTLGLIRLQWWRDTIAAVYAGKAIPEHEIVKPLAEAIVAYDLPKELFDKLCYAREFDLEDVLPGNLEGLMNYAEFTTEPLFALIVKVSGGDIGDAPIQPVAINYTLVGLLRAVPFHAQQGRCYLPEDLMIKHKVDRHDLFEKEQQDRLRLLIKYIVDERLQRSPHGHPFLKGADALAEMYFKQIRGLDYNVFSPLMSREPPFKVLKLFWKIKVM